MRSLVQEIRLDPAAFKEGLTVGALAIIDVTFLDGNHPAVLESKIPQPQHP